MDGGRRVTGVGGGGWTANIGWRVVDGVWRMPGGWQREAEGENRGGRGWTAPHIRVSDRGYVVYEDGADGSRLDNTIVKMELTMQIVEPLDDVVREVEQRATVGSRKHTGTSLKETSANMKLIERVFLFFV